MKKSLRACLGALLGVAVMPLMAHQASAAMIDLAFADGVVDTIYVSDQNATNAEGLYGSADAGKLIGNISAGRAEYIVLSVDLSSVPDGDTVTSASLKFSLDGEDTSANATNTADDIELYALASDPDTAQGHNFRYSSFGPDGSSAAADRADNTQWNGLVPGNGALQCNRLFRPRIAERH